MAYVITVVGAGGKSSYIDRKANHYIDDGKSVCVTTTTHIWNHAGYDSKIDYIGTDCDGKYTYPGDEEYAKICDKYDVVLVEGDGSRHIPIKIPGANEPVIPANTDEIVVVMGLHALGREFGTVCHRHELLDSSKLGDKYIDIDDNTIVTKDLIERLSQVYYMDPLSKRYPDAKISLYLSDMSLTGNEKDIHDIALVMTAAGFSTRFGSNKLLATYHGKSLYKHMLEHLIESKDILEDIVNCHIIVVSQYDEILSEINDIYKDIITIKNDRAAEGISASVKIGLEKAIDMQSDAIIYFTADMPHLDEIEISRFILQFMQSGATCGCMYADKEQVNPGAFRSNRETISKIRSLSGDRGAMKIIKEYRADTFYYVIDMKKVFDIDTKEDL